MYILTEYQFQQLKNGNRDKSLFDEIETQLIENINDLPRTSCRIPMPKCKPPKKELDDLKIKRYDDIFEKINYIMWDEFVPGCNRDPKILKILDLLKEWAEMED